MMATGGSSNKDSLIIIRDAPITFFIFIFKDRSNPDNNRTNRMQSLPFVGLKKNTE